MASTNFILPSPDKKISPTLIKGFGLPLVQRALLPKVPEIADEPDKKSMFGTPIYDSLFIYEPKYKIYTFNTQTNSYDTTDSNLGVVDVENGGVLIEGCILDVTQSRNIVRTEMIGVDGAVSEFISNGNYDINIRGFFGTKFADLFPDANTQMLREYCEATVALSVKSTWLNQYMGITEIIVESVNFFQRQSERNTQYFIIQAKSEISYEITKDTTK